MKTWWMLAVRGGLGILLGLVILLAPRVRLGEVVVGLRRPRLDGGDRRSSWGSARRRSIGRAHVDDIGLVSVERTGGGVLRLRLSGRWTLATRRPATADVLAHALQPSDTQVA